MKFKFKLGDKVKVKNNAGYVGTEGRIIDIYPSHDYVVKIKRLTYGLVFRESDLELSSEIEYNHPYTKLFK